MRPRGIGRGPIRAAMRQARYQRYYNRGSQANWESMKASDAKEAESLGKFFALAGLVISGVLIAFVLGSVSVFHGFVMVILTSPLWVGAAILLAICEPNRINNCSAGAASSIKKAVEVNRRQNRK